MREPTTQDIDALLGASTPHFAYQIRERVERLVAPLAGGSSGARVRGAAPGGAGRARPRHSRAEGGDPSAPLQSGYLIVNPASIVNAVPVT